MRNSLLIAAMAVMGLSTTVAHAQSADEVVQGLTADSSNLATAVAGYCQEADEAERDVQIGVGAGFAQAYLYFVDLGDQPSAGAIGQVACSCEQTPGDILSSYLASLGEAGDQACSSTWSVDRSVVSPSVFQYSVSSSAVSKN